MLKNCSQSVFWIVFLMTSAAWGGDGGIRLLQPGLHSDRNEVRFGVMAYDRGFFSTDDFHGTVVNGELLFSSPRFLEGAGSPRPYFGWDMTFADDPIHFFYAGLNWNFRLADRIYLGASLGAAIHTAENLYNPTTYKALGCRGLIHLGLALGYDPEENWTIQAYTDHFSNANMCDSNNGAEATGIRIGYRF